MYPYEAVPILTGVLNHKLKQLNLNMNVLSDIETLCKTVHVKNKINSAPFRILRIGQLHLWAI